MASRTSKDQGRGPSFFYFVMALGFAVLIFLPNHLISKLVTLEDSWIEQTHGKENADFIQNRGWSWYKTITIDSSLNTTVRGIFFREDGKEYNDHDGFSAPVQNHWYPFLEGRAAALSLMVRQMFVRLSLAFNYGLFFILMLIPLVWDGYCRWQIKRQRYGAASPVWNHLSFKTIAIAFLVTLWTFVLPLPIHPGIYPVAAMVFAFFASFWISNLPKEN